jgi:hypothetical protein
MVVKLPTIKIRNGASEAFNIELVTQAKRQQPSHKIYLATINRADIDEISSRPIFSDTRRKSEPFIEPEIEPVNLKPEQVEIEPVTPPKKPPEFQINGYIQQDGKTSVLIQQQSIQTWKFVGDMIEKWTIIEISRTGIMLTLNGEEFTMRMLH